MGQQISIEDALAAFRRRYGEAADENVLLRAQVDSLERRIAELEQERSGLRAQAEQPQESAFDEPR